MSLTTRLRSWLPAVLVGGHAHDVERAWFQEAGAKAFATLMGGLILMKYLGDALRLSWLSPIGLTHVLALGSGTFLASYAWLRLRNR